MFFFWLLAEKYVGSGATWVKDFEILSKFWLNKGVCVPECFFSVRFFCWLSSMCQDFGDALFWSKFPSLKLRAKTLWTRPFDAPKRNESSSKHQLSGSRGGGWNQSLFSFTPTIGVLDPIWRTCIFFRRVGEKPPTRSEFDGESLQSDPWFEAGITTNLPRTNSTSKLKTTRRFADCRLSQQKKHKTVVWKNSWSIKSKANNYILYTFMVLSAIVYDTTVDGWNSASPGM